LLLDLLATPQGISVRQAAARLAVNRAAAGRWLARLAADGLAVDQQGRFYLAAVDLPVCAGRSRR